KFYINKYYNGYNFILSIQLVGFFFQAFIYEDIYAGLTLDIYTHFKSCFPHTKNIKKAIVIHVDYGYYDPREQVPLIRHHNMKRGLLITFIKAHSFIISLI